MATFAPVTRELDKSPVDKCSATLYTYRLKEHVTGKVH